MASAKTTKGKSAKPAGRPAAAAKITYSPHPSIAMVQKSIAALKKKTGRTLDEWMKFIQMSGPADEVARRDWLKREHGMGANYAGWLAERSIGKGWEDDDPRLYLKAAAGYVETMYAGGKAPLRPLHDALLLLGLSLGDDVKICPCQTIVPLYRNHVFAQVKPSTRTRIDFGLCLKGYPRLSKLPKRLIDTGGLAKNDRITHRIEVMSNEDIDADLKNWLTDAYNLDARP